MSAARVLRDPWLVAAWPGMGSVAMGAGTYLVDKLSARAIGELPGRDYFEIERIEVRDGLAQPGRTPRSLLFDWRHPERRRDLLLFLGEAQPSTRGYAFCHLLLDQALSHGVKRVVTFAALATQLHPSAPPRVFGVATEPALIDEAREHGVHAMSEGQISGLNGVLLSAAAERGMGGLCLLGELPFFAIPVPNPRASLAVLETFAPMAGLALDLAELKGQADAAEHGLLELLERVKQGEDPMIEPGDDAMLEPDQSHGAEPREAASERRAQLDRATRHRIDGLFAAARRDRTKAVDLKRELDRLGVFAQFEDRFLDLFRKGE